MSSSVDHSPDFGSVRRQVAHQLYMRLAVYTAVVWTLGTFLLFVTFAAGNPRPIPMAAMSMILPLVPAILPWLIYRPLASHLAARRLARGDAASVDA